MVPVSTFPAWGIAIIIIVLLLLAVCIVFAVVGILFFRYKRGGLKEPRSVGGGGGGVYVCGGEGCVWEGGCVCVFKSLSVLSCLSAQQSIITPITHAHK